MARRRRYNFIDDQFLGRLQRLHLLAKALACHSGTVRRSRRLGDGLEFADHRAYSPGDDIRFVDWPCYARMERLLLRLFHEHGTGDVVILLDCSASMAPDGRTEKFYHALAAAAALAFVAMANFERVLLLPAAAELMPAMRTGRNRNQILDVLDFLDGLRASGKLNLERCARELAMRYRSAGTILLISDLLVCRDELDVSLAHLARGRADVTVLHIQSPADSRPQLAGPMLLQSSESSQRISVDLTPELREAYDVAWREFVESCRHSCVAREASYVSAPTDLPIERLILHTLRRAGVLTE